MKLFVQLIDKRTILSRTKEYYTFNIKIFMLKYIEHDYNCYGELILLKMNEKIVNLMKIHVFHVINETLCCILLSGVTMFL